MTARPMPLQRYEPATKYIGTGEYIAEMVTDTDGECVLYTDYLADRAALLKRIEELEEMNRNILAEYKKQIEELEGMVPRWCLKAETPDEFHYIRHEMVVTPDGWDEWWLIAPGGEPPIPLPEKHEEKGSDHERQAEVDADTRRR